MNVAKANWFYAAVICMVSGSAAADSVDREIEALNRRLAAEGRQWTAGRTSVSERMRGDLAVPLDPASAPHWLDPSRDVTPYHVHKKAPAVDPSAARFSWADADKKDWTSPIKNQGSCGSCAIFAAIGAVEARINISAGDPNLDLDLSEQHLLDCTPGSSCTTGTWYTPQLIPTLAQKGIPDEQCSPYGGVKGKCQESCKDAADRSFKVQGGNWLPSVGSMLDIANEKEIKAALVSGPVLASFVTPESFDHYRAGVYEDTPKVEDFVTKWHTVPIVGWDDHQDDGEPPSWICKNSWGTDWGQDGFFEIQRKSATRFGTQATEIKVDAQELAVPCPLPQPIRAEVDCERLECDQKTAVKVSLKLCNASGPSRFQIVAQREAAWLTAEPAEIELRAEEETAFDLVFSTAGLETAKVHETRILLLGQHGYAKDLAVQLNVKAPAVRADAGNDDGEENAEASSETPECGCKPVGRKSSPSSLFLLASLLAAR